MQHTIISSCVSGVDFLESMNGVDASQRVLCDTIDQDSLSLT